MTKTFISQDGLNISYQISAPKPTAIVFVHGWLGNANWWTAQREFFQDRYCIVQLDLAGHGRSEKGRTEWSSTYYADDIVRLTEEFECDNIILVGHSMSGAYVLEASLRIDRTKLIVIVDTLKDMDRLTDYKQADALMLQACKQDFHRTITQQLPQFLFAEGSPAKIREQILAEFLNNDAEFAVKAIEPLYKMDIKGTAKHVKVPVRAINSDASETNVESVRRHISNFNYSMISGCGHYPMLEKPEQFNSALQKLLQEFAF